MISYPFLCGFEISALLISAYIFILPFFLKWIDRYFSVDIVSMI